MCRSSFSTRMALVACALSCLMLFSATQASASDPIAAEKINWQKYLQSAAVVAAIASAVAVVDNCSKKPLLIQELNPSDGNYILVFTCQGRNDEASSIIHFESLGSGHLRATKFDFAG